MTADRINGVVGVRRPASDTDRPEPIDSAKRRRWRVSVGDGEDVRAIWGLLSYLIVPIILAGTAGFCIRLFLFAAGFREVL